MTKISVLDAQPKLQSSLLRGNRINIGNFEECLNVTSPYNFTGQYCLLSINTTKSLIPEDKSEFNDLVVRKNIFLTLKLANKIN